MKNTVVRDEFVETVAAYRNEICDGCKFKGNKCAVKGTGPCCEACGCSLHVKTRALSSACGLAQKGEMPKWLPVLTSKQEEDLMKDKP